MVFADRFAPTSKTCSTCGTAKATLPLAERKHDCTSCGIVMDRDVNAARNILTAGVMNDDAYGQWESRNADRAGTTDTSAAPASTSEGQDRAAAPATPAEESAGHPHIHTERGAA